MRVRTMSGPSSIVIDSGESAGSSKDYSVEVAVACKAKDEDQDLIAAAQRGERGAIDALVRRNDRWVRNAVYAVVGNAQLIDDVVQTVWTRAWQQIGTLVDPSRWRGWLYALARNAAIDAGQKIARQRIRQAPYVKDQYQAPEESDPSRSLARAEQHRRALSAIHGLPAIYREPFVLRHLEDWSYARIAEALELPIDTVETRLVRARRLLRSALADQIENGGTGSR